MTAVPQVLLNVKVSKKPELDSIPDLQQAIRESERRLNGSGRVLVRYSGTESLLRIMVEGEQDAVIREEADRLATIVTAHLG
jgi:phosphoglucosamine mutase